MVGAAPFAKGPRLIEAEPEAQSPGLNKNKKAILVDTWLARAVAWLFNHAWPSTRWRVSLLRQDLHYHARRHGSQHLPASGWSSSSSASIGRQPSSTTVTAGAGSTVVSTARIGGTPAARTAATPASTSPHGTAAKSASGACSGAFAISVLTTSLPSGSWALPPRRRGMPVPSSTGATGSGAL